MTTLEIIVKSKNLFLLFAMSLMHGSFAFAAVSPSDISKMEQSLAKDKNAYECVLNSKAGNAINHFSRVIKVTPKFKHSNSAENVALVMSDTPQNARTELFNYLAAKGLADVPVQYMSMVVGTCHLETENERNLRLNPKAFASGIIGDISHCTNSATLACTK